MTTGTLNFTGRRKIVLREIELRIVAENEKLLLKGALEVGGWPDAVTAEIRTSKAQLVLEPYRGLERFRCETPMAPPKTEFAFEVPTFAEADSILCDVKVVATEGLSRGKILAAAREIMPTLPDTEDANKSLLRFAAADLDEILWLLDLESDVPVVRVNRLLGDWRAFVRSKEFGSLVVPEICRGIGAWMWSRLDAGETDSETVAAWRRFFRDQLKCDPVLAYDADPEAQDVWLQEAVLAFARKHSIASKWIQESQLEVE